MEQITQVYGHSFHVYNYMRPEPGAIKDEKVVVDTQRHVYFKSAFLMNHSRGDWPHAYRFLRQLEPVDRVRKMLVADRSMVGLHVRNIFDAPRDAASANSTLGNSAIDGAKKEYGKEGADALLKWRQASHWTNFIGRMEEVMKAQAARGRPLRFYLAADSEEAYAGLLQRFNGSLVVTRRACDVAARCDFRDCTSLIYSLVDLLNLGRTRFILGSGYSSYSEVASWLGAYSPRPGDDIQPLRLEMAGRDFGKELLPSSGRMIDPTIAGPSARCPAWEDVLNTPRDKRWILWEAGKTAKQCPSGCGLRNCRNNRNAPCCVKRLEASWPVDCELLPYGCSRRHKDLVPGHVVLDQHAVPKLSRSKRCPAWEDIVNTANGSRWHMWEAGPSTKQCPSGCGLKGCNHGRNAPCCVKRLEASWPMQCGLLPHGCPRIGSNLIPGHYVFDQHAVPAVAPSDTCPTREDVLNTAVSKRWEIWTDESCLDACRFVWCDEGRLAPCCVKRLLPTFQVDCAFLPHGCFDPNSTLAMQGVVVRDLRTEAMPTLVPSTRCPSREDVMNTAGAVRQSLWDDPNCEAGCALGGCTGTNAPCCVKRMLATWAVDCESQDYGCYYSFSVWWWRGLVVHDRKSGFLLRYQRELVLFALMFIAVGMCVTSTIRAKPRVSADNGGGVTIGSLVGATQSALTHAGLTQQNVGRLSDAILFVGAALVAGVVLLLQSLDGGWVTAQPERPQVERPHLPEQKNTTTPAPLVMPCAEDKIKVETFKAQRWMVEGESAKAGAGLLFFAYGATKTLNHFLLEAEKAGRSFREHNPGLLIAVVSNNATVDRFVFDKHIMPRLDLLFPGDTDNGGQKRGDKLPRQWLTRLYYIAHSPFELTWALDSNVISCTPGAAQVFMQNALVSRLWGYHIAHASQNVLGRGDSDVMYPHNFNIVYIWSEASSALMREWFLANMRNGVAADDQKTLHIAEMRLVERSGLNIGKISPAFGAAFYNVHNTSGGGGLRSDRARVTPILPGRVHVVHSPDQSLCAKFNTHADAPRQVLMRTTSLAHRDANGKFIPSVYGYGTMRSYDECASWLSADSQYCLLDEPYQPPSVESVKRMWVPGAEKVVKPNAYVTPVLTENHLNFGRSNRCGLLCSDHVSIDTLGRIPLMEVQEMDPHEKAHESACTQVPSLAKLALHNTECGRGDLLRAFTFTSNGCPKRTSKGVAWMHAVARCSRNAESGLEFEAVERYTGCAPARIEAVSDLAYFNASCPPSFALAGFSFTSEGCAQPDQTQLRVSCVSVVAGNHVLIGRTLADQQRAIVDSVNHLKSEHDKHRLKGAEVYGVLPVRPGFYGSTPCTADSSSMKALEPHALSCPVTHAINAFRVAICSTRVAHAQLAFRFEYHCVPVRRPTAPVPFNPPHVGNVLLGGAWKGPAARTL